MTIELTDEQKIKLINSDDVFGVMQEILLREEKIDQEREHFWMVGLANNNRMQYIELVSLGSVNATTVEPMNVFRWAVMKGSVKVILIHNHPSGELKPSDIDLDLTDRLIQVGAILNIKVIEHLIISTKSYLSFLDTGLLEELEKSTKWIPQYLLIDKIRREQKKIMDEAIKSAEKKGIEKGVKKGLEQGVIKGKEEGVKEGLEQGVKIGIKEGFEKGIEKEKIEIAQGMKKDKEPIEKIMKYTGLTREEIEKLKV